MKYSYSNSERLFQSYQHQNQIDFPYRQERLLGRGNILLESTGCFDKLEILQDYFSTDIASSNGWYSYGLSAKNNKILEDDVTSNLLILPIQEQSLCNEKGLAKHEQINSLWKQDNPSCTMNNVTSVDYNNDCSLLYHKSFCTKDKRENYPRQLQQNPPKRIRTSFS